MTDQMDKSSREIITGLSEISRLGSEADPEGISGELAFFLLIQCERICDKLRIRLQQTGMMEGFGGNQSSPDLE